MKENIILQKTLVFSVDISNLAVTLRNKGDSVISKQLLRSATSIGANVHEATAAISRKDFILKMTIASKEARESMYWLNILNASRMIDLDYSHYLKSAEEIVKILTAIIKTSQSKQ
ncbi:MAG: four helix bundle protein [Bacteroidales bacterium]|jgi:four helix bundle protein|nr:four helix bundle protein [Bacteroidales bacterium]